ncbi:MAG TPA: helix-turn-helix domain-containing protein [Burkholderiales bacterium]|nr:helix-turn-helix domain-containing protein [Burkholderiales bacterium]
MTDGVDPGSGVGEELAHARAGLRLSLAEVAQQLKFSVRQIETLEQDRFEELPAGTFARGMVRAYARLLKLDAEPLVARMAARVAVPDNAAAVASVRRPIPITDSARRINMVYGALSVAILAVIAAVAFEWQRERSDASRLSFVAAAAPVEPQRAAEAAANPVAPPNLSPLAAATPVQPAEARAAPVSSSASRPESRAANGASDELRRIVMKFDRESWVQIRNRDGKILFSQLNAAGSERTIEGRAPFNLIVGNAQYVRMSYDDHPVDLTPYVKVEVARFTLD